MIVPVKTDTWDYDIVLEPGALKKAGELLNLNRRALIVTDSGVPARYAETVAKQCKEAVIVTIPQGEQSKCFEEFNQLLQEMLDASFTRSDCVVAVGGGVVGDLSGFAASCYMRGVDFYNIPTTLLSQVDSSIGGKTAIDFGGVKNIVGAFYQPKKVIIDPLLLSTLEKRQISNGFAEAVKIAVTSDEKLFEIFESGKAMDKIEEVIFRAVSAKRDVVEKDEKESSLRRVLNFGHTLGHAIESSAGLGELLHGECVALGMLPMCGSEIRPRVEKALQSVGLKTEYNYNADAVKSFLKHDKKASGNTVNIVLSDKIGSFYFKKVSLSQLEEMI